MSVSVNTVYQKVLAVLNKEKRGYLPPNEFEYLANTAQLDIFEQYFYDINQFSRIPGNNTEYGDVLTLLQEKVAIFEKTAALGYDTVTERWVKPSDMYRFGSIFYDAPDPVGSYVLPTECERVTRQEWLYVAASPLSGISKKHPVFIEHEDGYDVYFGPTTAFDDGDGAGSADEGALNKLKINYVRKPLPVKWTYTTVNNAPVYNASSVDKQDFELHASDETELIFKILELAGIALREPAIAQMGAQMDAQKYQQEKS